MNYLKSLRLYTETYNFEIMLGMAILIALLLVFSLINRVKISKNTKSYKELGTLLNAPTSENMEETIVEYIHQVNLMKNSIYSLEAKNEELNSRLKKSIQQVCFSRYNAFEDMGSDLSFSVALLDDNSDGFVMTNIYARDESNIYAKPIINGTSTYELSLEEKSVIEKAMDGNKKAETQEN